MENIITKFQEKDSIIAILSLCRIEKIWRFKFSKNIQSFIHIQLRFKMCGRYRTVIIRKMLS